MDNLFTHELKVSEKTIRASLRGESSLSPKESTLDFLKNFASNFRADRQAESSIQGFVLN